MKILIDIGHPAHVHYFKNFIRIMQTRGHEFLVIARDKEISIELLNKFKIPYKNRGKGGKNLITKILYIPYADLYIYLNARKFKPDLFLSFSSTYAAHASKLFGKPHIALDDTEHAKFELFMYPPFTDTILNPSCFTKHLGDKQIFFNSYIELLYLHKNYFTPNIDVLRMLNVKQDERFAIIRFVSWNASHDVSQKGLSDIQKIELVNFISKKIKVFVSSEGEMPAELEVYKFPIPPEHMHDALYFATIYVGEGGTTASESALLGTPAVYLNKLSMGYIEDEKKAGLICQSVEYNEIKKSIESFLSYNSKKEFYNRLDNLIKDKIDPTSFLIWFIESYPESIKIMKENKNFQNNFK
jgi:predicted glycosyltransferase